MPLVCHLLWSSLFAWGQALLELPPQGAGEVEVVYLPLCGSLSHKTHLL